MKIPAKLHKYVVQDGVSPESFSKLPEHWQQSILDKARRARDTDKAKKHGIYREFKCVTSCVNANIGPKILRHTFLRNKERDVEAEYFIGEVLQILENLENTPELEGRVYYNYIFSFIMDTGNVHTYSLDKEAINKLGPKEAIRELLKMEYNHQCELYKYGSGEDVLSLLQNSRLLTNKFEIYSTAKDNSPLATLGVTSRLPNYTSSKEGDLPDDVWNMRFYSKKLSSCISARYIGFDFETIVDRDTGLIKPYAISAIVYDGEGEEIRRYTKISYKARSVKARVVEILQREKPSSKEENVYLIGFNNANFDNFLLYEIAVEYGVSHSEPFIARNSLLGLTVEGMIVRDLFRFVMVSLEKGCKDFKCRKTKGSLEHWEVQKAYYKGDKKFKNYLRSNHDKIKEYVETDVASMMELWFKCKASYYTITGLNIEDYMTLASLSYAAFKETVPKEKWDRRPLLTKDQEEHIRQATYGGRSQVFKPMTQSKHRVVEGDVVSLYPFVMACNSFPLDEIRPTPKYVEGKLGVYHVIVTRQPDINVLPLKDKGCYDWHHKGPLDCWVESVTLEVLWKYGGKARVLEGYWWPDSADVFSKYIQNLFTTKREQDRYKDASNSRYNPSLRNIVKLLMNSLSGKVIQRTYTTTTKIIETKTQLEKFRLGIIPSSFQILQQGNTAYVTGELKEDYIRRSIPVIWGILIYGYARKYMYENVYTLIPDLLYTETDSYVASLKNAVKHREKFPHMYGKEMGQLGVSYEDRNARAIAVSKKCSCIYDKGTNEIIKSTFKGVNQAKDKLITPQEFALFTCDKDKYKWYWDKAQDNRLVSKDTYLRLVNGEEISILCSQLTRSIKPSPNIEPIAHVKQIFRLKKFSIKTEDSDVEDTG